MKKTLITYLSPHGSTHEVCTYLEKTLTALGTEVTLLQFEAVTSLDPYDAVLVAAPVNGMQWRPEAVSFIQTHQEALKEKTVAYLALALMVDQGRPMWQKAVQKAFTKASEIVAPTNTGIFAGLASAELPAFMRWVFGLPKDMPKDLRDWQKIDAFARKFHRSLLTE